MSEMPPNGPSYGQSASGFPASSSQFAGAPAGPRSWAPAAPRGQSRALTFVALAVALIATGLAIVGWFRPTPQPAASHATDPTYTDQQVADAKRNVCETYATVKKVVKGNTNRVNPVPGDQVGDLASGIYAPVSLYDGGDYVLRSIAEEPATQKDLADLLKGLGQKLQKLAMVELTGNLDATRDAIRHDLDSDVTAIDGLCK